MEGAGVGCKRGFVFRHFLVLFFFSLRVLLLLLLQLIAAIAVAIILSAALLRGTIVDRT